VFGLDMNVYLLFEKHQAYAEPPRCLGYVRARTPEGAAGQVGRKLLHFQTHESLGMSFTCKENQWLVWGTGGHYIIWLEEIPKVEKR
jgi:hypothetical protein